MGNEEKEKNKNKKKTKKNNKNIYFRPNLIRRYLFPIRSRKYIFLGELYPWTGTYGIS